MTKELAQSADPAAATHAPVANDEPVAGPAVVRWNAKLEITGWNAAATRLFGWNAEEATGRPRVELLDEAESTPRLRGLWGRLAAGAPEEIELRGQRTKEGALLRCRWSHVMVAGARGPEIISLGEVDEQARAADDPCRRRLAEVARIARFGHWEWNIRTGAFDCSDEGLAILGLAKNSFDSTFSAFMACIDPKQRARTTRALDTAVADRTPLEQELSLRRDRDLPRRVRQVGRVIYGPDGKPDHMSGTLQDITEQHLAKERSQLAQRIFDTTAEGIVVTDLAGTIVDVNPAFCAITGYLRHELIGKNPRIMKSDRHDKSFYQNMWRTIRETGTWQGEIWDRRRDGEAYPKWLEITTIADSQERPSKYLGLFRDLSQVKHDGETVHFLTRHDALTGLPNRFLLMDRVSIALREAEGTEQQVAVLLMSLTGFSAFNEGLGYRQGDDILVAISERLRESAAPDGFVARLGGDEFAAVLPRVTNPSAAARVAMELQRAASQPLCVGGRELFPGIRVGVAISPADGADPETLVRNAATAMRKVTPGATHGFVFYAPRMNNAAEERLSLESELRRAFDEGAFELHYQPRIDTVSQKVVGAEALLRWRGGPDYLVSPGLFIPLAEQVGIIGPLGRWALWEACSQFQRWRAAGFEPPMVSVNISPRELHERQLVASTRRIIADTGWPAEMLELELTETGLMVDAAAAREVVARLHTLGLRLAVDDFGTGYSSLSHLRQLPLHTLKIDRSFVSGLAHSRQDAAIVRAVIALGESLDLRVVAEGVEDAGQFDFLKRHGCAELQGFYFGRPVAAEEFEKAYLKEPAVR